MLCYGKLKLRSRNTSYCLIEVVTKANIGGIVDHHNLIKMGAIMVMIVW